jgi:hypothetical protein
VASLLVMGLLYATTAWAANAAWRLASYGAALIVEWAGGALLVLLTLAALVWVIRLFMAAVRCSMPPPTLAERPIARTAQFVGAAAASLLVVGLVDVRAWGPPALVWMWQVLAVLLTLPALVWVTRLFIRALRSSMPRALIALVAVPAVSVLGLYLWHTMTLPSPRAQRAQVLALVHVLQPCVRAVNRTLPLLTPGPQQDSGAAAHALADQYAVCSTAWGRLGPQPGTDSRARGAWFGAMEALWQASGHNGDWREDVGFYAWDYGEGMLDFVLSAAPVLHVSPGCVAAALDWSTAVAHHRRWPSAGAGCPRLSAILR